MKAPSPANTRDPITAKNGKAPTFVLVLEPTEPDSVARGAVIVPAEVVVLPKARVEVSLDETASVLKTTAVPVVALFGPPVVLEVLADEVSVDEASVDEGSETFRPPWSSLGMKEKTSPSLRV